MVMFLKVKMSKSLDYKRKFKIDFTGLMSKEETIQRSVD